MDSNIVPAGGATSGPGWDSFLARFDGYFSRTDYETVDGQPLVFWNMGKSQAQQTFGSVDAFRTFANTWAAAAVKQPHFVLMEGYDSDYFNQVGFPTRSQYANPGDKPNEPFSSER